MSRVELPDDHPLRPYRRDAADWRDAHLARLAETVGGGEVGPAAQAIVSSAALQHCASRWLFDRAALELDPKLVAIASALANDARQNLLAAHELVARESKGRPRAFPAAMNVEAADRLLAAAAARRAHASALPSPGDRASEDDDAGPCQQGGANGRSKNDDI